MHPLEKIDAELNLPVGLTRSVIALHDTENVPVLRAALVKFGIRVNDDTSIPKEDRIMWRALAQACELPPEWWMDDAIMEEGEDVRELPDDLPPPRRCPVCDSVLAVTGYCYGEYYCHSGHYHELWGNYGCTYMVNGTYVDVDECFNEREKQQLAQLIEEAKRVASNEDRPREVDANPVE